MGVIHLCVCGPSGVGKSAVERWMSEHAGVLWLEADQTPRDGLEILGLRAAWDAFRGGGEGAELFGELDRRVAAKRRRYCVLSFPSTVMLEEAEVERARERMACVWLEDAPGACLERFLGRVPEMERGAAIRHWAAHSAEVCARLAAGRVAGRRVPVTRAGGGLRGLAEVAEDVERARDSSPWARGGG